jgi:phosphoribosylglycinamide formyltransferase-1
MPNFAIFASGNGTNAENIIRYFSQHETIHCQLVVSNRKDAFVHKRAEKLGVPSIHLSTGSFKEEPQKILHALEQHNIDFIVLAGFMALIPKEITEVFHNRIVNIHPALLPAFGGKGMYGDHVHKAVIASGEKQSGISIHFVNERYDEGRIIFQAACPVSNNDTVESLAEKIHELEYAHYPAIIEQIIKENS